MRILILSDTHGDIGRARQVYAKLQTQSPVDLLIHCGDTYQDAIKLSEETGVKSVWVKGNTDGAFSEKDYAIVETECGNLFVTHGHMQKVDFSMQTLYYTALEYDCRAAIFGHTHRAVFTETGGISLMNPGSLTKPRDGSGGTFGLLLTGEQYLQGKIYFYDQFMAETKENRNGSDTGNAGGAGGGSSHPKVQGGFLRGLLNYSDRF